MERIQICSLVCGYLVLSVPFAEQTILSPIELFWHNTENQLPINTRIYVWSLKSIPPIYNIYPYVCTTFFFLNLILESKGPVCLDYGSFVVKFWNWSMSHPTWLFLLLLLKISLPTWIFLWIEDQLVNLCKEPCWYLFGIVFNLYINLRNTTILKILSLLNHEHEMFFHLFGSSLAFFNSFAIYRVHVLYFVCYSF